MKLPERPEGKYGAAWWKSLTHKEKMDEVRPLVLTFHMGLTAIQQYLGLPTTNMVASIRSYINEELRQERINSGLDIPPPKIKKGGVRPPSPITLAGPPLSKSLGEKFSPFPSASKELPDAYIRAIESMYN